MVGGNIDKAAGDNIEEIIIFKELSNPICADSEDGKIIYEKISHALKNNKKIKLSFDGIDIITSAFLNTAIGQLLKEFNRDFLKNNVAFESLKNEDAVLLKRVIDTAERYYNSPDHIKKSLEDILNKDNSNEL